jgi:hypothetical protein
MAKKKQPVVVEEKYFARYREDGDIFGLSFEPIDLCIELEKSVAEKFLAGLDSYNKYRVDAGKLVLKGQEPTNPKFGIFERITDIADNQAMIVECDLKNKQWNFITKEGGRTVMYVADPDDYNKLIRTIIVDLAQTNSVKFISELEQTTNLAVLTKKYMASYGLRFINEN